MFPVFVFEAFAGKFHHLSVSWHCIEFSVWTVLLFFLSSLLRQQVYTKDYSQVGTLVLWKGCILVRECILFGFFSLPVEKWPLPLNTEIMRRYVHPSRNLAAFWDRYANNVSHFLFLSNKLKLQIKLSHKLSYQKVSPELISSNPLFLSEKNFYAENYSNNLRATCKLVAACAFQSCFHFVNRITESKIYTNG